MTDLLSNVGEAIVQSDARLCRPRRGARARHQGIRNRGPHNQNIGIVRLWPIHLTGVVLVGGSPGSPGGWAFQGRWMAAGAWGLAGRLFWLRVGDQVAVAHGVVVDGELEDPVEQHAAAR